MAIFKEIGPFGLPHSIARYKGRDLLDAQFFGATANQLQIADIPLADGRFFAEADYGHRRDVAVVAANLEFRSEFFNGFNRVNLAGVHSDIADPLFGKSTRAFAARNIQFGLRLSF